MSVFRMQVHLNLQIKYPALAHTKYIHMYYAYKVINYKVQVKCVYKYATFITYRHTYIKTFMYC